MCVFSRHSIILTNQRIKDASTQRQDSITYMASCHWRRRLASRHQQSGEYPRCNRINQWETREKPMALIHHPGIYRVIDRTQHPIYLKHINIHGYYEEKIRQDIKSQRGLATIQQLPPYPLACTLHRESSWARPGICCREKETEECTYQGINTVKAEASYGRTCVWYYV